jgi:hypothetical protein
MPREKVIERFKETVSSWATRELHLYHPLAVEFNEQEGQVEIYSSKVSVRRGIEYFLYSLFLKILLAYKLSNSNR